MSTCKIQKERNSKKGWVSKKRKSKKEDKKPTSLPLNNI